MSAVRADQTRRTGVSGRWKRTRTEKFSWKRTPSFGWHSPLAGSEDGQSRKKKKDFGQCPFCSGNGEQGLSGSGGGNPEDARPFPAIECCQTLCVGFCAGRSFGNALLFDPADIIINIGRCSVGLCRRQGELAGRCGTRNAMTGITSEKKRLHLTALKGHEQLPWSRRQPSLGSSTENSIESCRYPRLA